MNIIIHRGTHQIGGSCIELATANTRIILDIGQELPPLDEDSYKKKPKLPKVDGLFKGDPPSVDAIFVSHGHGDHIGLIEDVNPEIPVYIGDMAARIYNTTAQFTGSKQLVNPCTYLVSGQEIKVGDFNVTPYLVDHSAFDAYALVIKAEGKSVVYTGDLRDHGRKKKATDVFRYSIPKNIDALLMEGTMINRLGQKTATEEQIEIQAQQFMLDKDRPVLVLQSAANIDRLVGMYKASRRIGRIFVMDIFTAHIVSQLGGSIPHPGKFKGIRVFYPSQLTQRMFKEADGEQLMKQFNRYWISRKELGDRSDYCMLIRATMLSDLYNIKGLQGAGFVYSMWNGYKKTARVQRILKYAEKMGMDVVNLHSSGHASIDALQRIANACSPQKLIPIHTEKPELFLEKFKNVYISKDNEICTL